MLSSRNFWFGVAGGVLLVYGYNRFAMKRSQA